MLLASVSVLVPPLLNQGLCSGSSRSVVKEWIFMQMSFKFVQVERKMQFCCDALCNGALRCAVGGKTGAILDAVGV